MQTSTHLHGGHLHGGHLHGGSCLGRTCLKWRHDGELAHGDLELVLERLAQVDQDMAAERQRNLTCEPCPSIS